MNQVAQAPAPVPPQYMPQNQPSGPSSLSKGVKFVANIVLSSAYCASGVAMMAIGAGVTYYSLQQLNHFYFSGESSSSDSSLFTRWTTLNSKEYNGLGEPFYQVCSSLSTKLDVRTGDTICSELAKHPWKEISGVDSATSAIAITIIGEGAILYVSAGLVMGGASLFSKGISLLGETLL